MSWARYKQSSCIWYLDNGHDYLFLLPLEIGQIFSKEERVGPSKLSRSVSKVVTEKWAQLDLAHNMLDNDHKNCGARKSLPRRKDELDRQANEQSVRW